MTCTRRPGATWSGCTCPTCQPLNLRARKRYYALGERHTPTRRAARTRLDRWTDEGYGSEWIASATGIPFGTIWHLTHDSASDLPHIANARAIIAADITTATTGKRDAHGVTRRLQALAALGWGGPEIAAASGLPAATISGYQAGQRSQVTATTWHRVMAAWDQLADRRGASARTIKRARANRWAPPAAWDDIDNPASEPTGLSCTSGDCPRPVLAQGLCSGHYEERRTGRTLKNRTWIDAEALRDFAGWGMTIQQAADRLGVQRDSIVTHLHRRGDPDVAARFARNDAAWEWSAA